MGSQLLVQTQVAALVEKVEVVFAQQAERRVIVAHNRKISAVALAAAAISQGQQAPPNSDANPGT
jgi:hypothetical protein